MTIYEIQKNKNKLRWTKEWQKVSEYSKELLITPPVLRMPTASEKFLVRQ